MGGDLNPKQARFIEEYLLDLNATQAAIRAGYSAKTAGQQGERLLKNVEVQAAVQAQMDERSKRTEITADYVLSTIQTTIERCSGAGLGYNPNAVLKGAELLGKHLKMFTDKVEHSGGVSVEIVRFSE